MPSNFEDTSPIVELISDVAASSVKRQRIFYRVLFYAIVILMIIILFILWWRPYQFLIFSQLYSVGRCAVQRNGNQCTVAPYNEWTIHGIWPDTYDSHPAFCKMDKKSIFNEYAIWPILSDLKERWPSTDGDEQKFWKHEWEKHGTCALESSPLKSELQYFQQAVTWNRNYSIKDILDKYNIYPSNDRKYQLSDFLNALETELSADVSVVCQYSKKKNAYVLVEVRICFSMSLDIINCDVRDASCPEDDIYYLQTTGI